MRPPQCHGLRFIMPFSPILLAAFFVFPIFAQDMASSENPKQADELSVIAVKRAAAAKEACDCHLQQEALESINKAAALLSEAVAEAENTGNLALAQEVYDIAANIVAQAIVLVTEVCTYCSEESVDVETVRCFAESCAGAAETRRLNNETIEAAMDAGAIPARPQAKAAKGFPVESPSEVVAPVTPQGQGKNSKTGQWSIDGSNVLWEGFMHRFGSGQRFQTTCKLSGG